MSGTADVHTCDGNPCRVCGRSWTSLGANATQIAARFSRRREYEVCRRRGHEPGERTLASNPPWSVCRWCGTHYRYEEPRPIETNVAA